MSEIVDLVPDPAAQIAALRADLAAVNAALAARDLLIETLRIQIARPSTARRAGAQESHAADEVRGVVRKA